MIRTTRLSEPTSKTIRQPHTRPPVTFTMPITGKVSSLYVFSAKYPKCCFCGSANRGALTTGVLPGIGCVWKCPECQGLYEEAREAKTQ